ncbi:hypothetical protein CF326_g482 [Tilletia indica]|nr:hypothetical protein CF326_g482 [Tilletia indica]
MNTATESTSTATHGAATIPQRPQQFATESMRPMYEHCGIMTRGLHRLDGVEQLMTEMMRRNEQYVQAMHSKIRDDLRDVVRRIQQQIGDTVGRIEGDLGVIEEYSRTNLQQLLSTTHNANSDVSRDVRAGQAAWIQTQSQLVSAWTGPWPQAIRSPDGGEALAPPEYDQQNSSVSRAEDAQEDDDATLWTRRTDGSSGQDDEDSDGVPAE